MSALISVIIPVYNVEAYITECLDSVLSQSHRDIEVICVDDCGKDGSLAIAERYAEQDSRVKIIRHEHNRGVGPARNTGMDAASGEYIYMCIAPANKDWSFLEIKHPDVFDWDN